MRYTEKKGKTLNLDQKPASDGSELIPSEVQATTRREGTQSPNQPLPLGYTVDDEGLSNNYAIEPDMSSAEYPSPKQQQRYIFWGAGAILFVTIIVMIAFIVS